jgi:hypothetical protein
MSRHERCSDYHRRPPAGVELIIKYELDVKAQAKALVILLERGRELRRRQRAEEGSQEAGEGDTI